MGQLPAPAVLEVDPQQLAGLVTAMRSRPVILLGEVHDHRLQHALRAKALTDVVQAGARPALVFEQFDADRQAALDAAVAADPQGDVDARTDRVIAAVGGKGWDWTLYRPYVRLALQYGLPLRAGNLSRAGAMRVAQEGARAQFGAGALAQAVDGAPDDLLQGQEREIRAGHCGQVPEEALPAMARAQIARDAVLASTLQQALTALAGRKAAGDDDLEDLCGGPRAHPPQFPRVVVLTGNGHARRDIGIVRQLPPELAKRVLAIGLLETPQTPAAGGTQPGSDDAGQRLDPAVFDQAFFTPEQARPDPCKGLKMPSMGTAR
jgi:uncharacterized iron-regulated protein